MATRRVNDPNRSESRQPPATTPDVREQQLTAAAFDLAEKQIRDGSASAQVVTHFLKMGSTRERLEQQRMQHEIELLQVRAEAMESAKKVEELYGLALNAMRTYAGGSPMEIEAGDGYDD